MAGKAVMIHYPGRGMAEVVRLTLAAAGIEWTHGDFIDTPDKLKALRASGKLFFNSLPLVEYNGMEMVESMAICRYFADLKDMMGTTKEERYKINMLADGAHDMNEPFDEKGVIPEDVFESKVAGACNRYLPKFEKVLVETNTGYLVGNKLSLADVIFFEDLTNVELYRPAELQKYPKCTALMNKIKELPSMKKYLASDLRHPPMNPEYTATVRWTTGRTKTKEKVA